MKLLFLTLLLGVTFYSSRAQKFFLQPTDKNIEQKVREKMDYDGYKLVKEEKDADYKVECLIQTVSTVNMKYKGYIRVTNLKTGKEVGRTKELTKKATAFRGYNAGNAIFKNLAEDQLDKILAKCTAQ
jgi:hypothetical protein